jgi:hypothetical protein
MDYNTIEINLEPSGSQVPARSSATYEEAFLGGGLEEMSNARGRGRARRKKRRLERIKNRREVRTERRKLKSDRQEERLARRRKRKQLRQEMRDEQQEARMERRNKRREDRENRRGNEPEGDEEDEDTQTTQDTGSDERDEDQNSGSGSGSTSSDEDTGSTSYDEDDEDAGSDDEVASEDDEEASFDGVNYDFDGESSDFISEATGGTSKVSPMIQEICMKIEWNNEMLMRLANKKKQMLEQGKDVSAINSALDQKFDRVQTLENKLENFTGADGRKNRNRSKEVQLAKKMARRKRLAMASNVIPPVLIAKLLKRGLSKEQIQQWWAKKGKKRFGKSSFEGDPSISDRVIITDEPVDTENWGMPSTEFDIDLGGGAGFDPMSFANGETSGSGNFWKSVLIGVAVGGVLIYVIRKYKLLKD